MADARHTAGPWVAIIGRIGWKLEASGAERIGHINEWPALHAEAEANATLIAAAPDLLEALRRFLDVADILGDGPGDSDTVTVFEKFEAAAVAGRAALTKAEGRS